MNSLEDNKVFFLHYECYWASWKEIASHLCVSVLTVIVDRLGQKNACSVSILSYFIQPFPDIVLLWCGT